MQTDRRLTALFPTDDRSALNARQRAAHLAEMASRSFDLVIIGGGVTGVGAALDAATRHMNVALIEQRDYASGTSSRSSKMFHGGLRYLEQYNFKLVREALRERNLMANHLCPHLVAPISFIYPIGKGPLERLYVGAGVLIYELLARLASNPLPRHAHLGRRRLEELSPALSASGGIRYWDTVVDDARHTLTVARTAALHGARMATSTRATGFDIADGRIQAVEALDLEGGRPLRIRTKAVINATGVWTDDIEGHAGERGIDVQASKGVHLVVPRDRIASDTGIILRTETSVLFVIPWRDHWIVGTTDTPWSLRRAHPAASRTDIEYLLRWVNTALHEPLSAEDIVGVYAGLRPLLRGESEETSKLSREHAVRDLGNGLVTIAGGKYTTYRVMAADAVDAASTYTGRNAGSSTAEVPLVGAMPYRDDRLVSRYGSLAGELSDNGMVLVDDAPYLRSEVKYGVTHEGALHLDDILTRRTRISVETRHRGVEATASTTAIMGDLLGWDHPTRDREIRHYTARVEAELDSQNQPDDHTADAARMGAPDVRTGIAE